MNICTISNVSLPGAGDGVTPGPVGRVPAPSLGSAETQVWSLHWLGVEPKGQVSMQHRQGTRVAPEQQLEAGHHTRETNV